MTVTKWYYRELSDDEPRNEFMGYSQFTSTSVVEAFVREVIQNSIDAKRPDQEVVRVDFRFATADDTARDAFFGGDLGVHLGMRDALQDGDRNRFDELRDSGTKSWASPLRYLAVEDWGTLGIEGDHETGPRRTDNMNKNRFRYFHWSFGQTDTTVEDKGGSWGYGRAALTLASKTLTIMALSTRNQHPGNDSTVHQSLMGNSIIRTHSYAGKEYSWFGHYCDTDGNSRMPLISTSESQREEVEDFKTKFGISRTISHEDKGLSIVVPFPKDDFTPHSVARAVLKSYFAAITVNQLVVTVSDQDEGIQWKFDNDGMKHHLKNEELEWTPNAGDKIDPMEITDFIQLMERGFVQDPIELVPESKDSHPSIQEMLGSMNSEDRKKYHTNLTKPTDSQTLRFEIKMPLEDINGKWHWGCFKVFIPSENKERQQSTGTSSEQSMTNHG